MYVQVLFVCVLHLRNIKKCQWLNRDGSDKLLLKRREVEPGYIYSPAGYDEFCVYGHRTITELRLIENNILK